MKYLVTTTKQRILVTIICRGVLKNVFLKFLYECVWDTAIKLLAQKALERTSTWEVIVDNCGKKMREAMTASCAGEAK